MPRTSEQWLWIIIGTAIFIGAAGGWAFLAWLTINSIRARRYTGGIREEGYDATQ